MENELKKRAKFHRKRQKGLPALSTLNPNAGNVEYNVAMFNHMNTPTGGFTNNPISGPMGGDVSAGSMGESVSMNNEWMLIKNSKWYDPEGLGIEPKGEIICSGTEEECREVFSEFVVEARQKDRLYKEQAIKGHHRPMMGIEKLDAYSLVLNYPNAQAKDVYQLVQKKDNTVTETLNEATMTREQMISELHKAGKKFYFPKYTDGQIYNMYMKYVVNAPKAVDDTVSVEQEPEVFEEKPTCPDCGTRLTDGGYCPKCDDGEEDMNEMLTEGNNVSSQLTPALDFFLQDIAQIHGTINYNDIMNHKYTEEDIKKLRGLRKQWKEEAQYDSDETDTILSNIADEVASILKVSALEEARNPYFAPYGYRDAAKALNGKAPEYYYHLKEIEMDRGDGIKLAKYALRKGLPVMVDMNSDPDYPEFAIKGEYHWNDYFYPYPSAHEHDLVAWDGKMFIDEQLAKSVLKEEDDEVIVTDNISIIGQDVVLYYDSLTIIAYGPKRDVDDWDEWEVDTATAYTVDQSDIIDYLYTIATPEELPSDDISDEELEEFWNANLKKLLRKYQKNVLEHYYSEAAMEAEENYTEDLDDDFDMSTRSLF